MTEKKSLVEEAILQMKNLEEAVAENAKGILASTMRQEIKDLVKESLKEQDDEEIGYEEGNEMEMEDDEMNMEDDEMEMEDDEMDMEDDEMDMSEPNMEVDTIDLTNQPTSQVLKVFKLLSPEDEIVVTKDNAGNINLKDNEKEYMIVSEGYDDYDEKDFSDDLMEYDELIDLSDEDETMEGYETDMMEEYLDDEEVGHVFADEVEETIYEVEMEDYSDDEEDEDYFDGEEFYESDYDEGLMEGKKSMKPKGMGMGSASKFKFPKQTTDFKQPRQKEGSKLPKGLGKKVKYEFDPSSPSLDGEFSKKPTKPKKETKESMTMMPKKVETKEASRTLGSGSNFRKGGLPKPKAHSKFNANIDESVDTQELNLLREKNEEYRKALNIFRNKLNEVAIFNSNLAYATRLFTEHSTSKQEKVNILKRFDGVETLKESKNLYKVIKDELSNTKTQQVNESVERTIQKSPSTGSAINLIESKTYENPQFLRMKDLMSKLK